MTTQDANVDALDRSQPRRRVVFDPTINLGHLISLSAFLIAALMAYSTLDKRVTLTEMQGQVSSDRDAAQDARLKEALAELKVDIKDVQRSVNDINRTLAITSSTSPKK